MTDGVVVHAKPLTFPQQLKAEELWDNKGFDGLLDALKYAGPLSIVKVEGLKSVTGAAVEGPETFTAEWFERLNADGVSAFMRAILDAALPGKDFPNG